MMKSIRRIVTNKSLPRHLRLTTSLRLHPTSSNRYCYCPAAGVIGTATTTTAASSSSSSCRLFSTDTDINNEQDVKTMIATSATVAADDVTTTDAVAAAASPPITTAVETVATAATVTTEKIIVGGSTEDTTAASTARPVAAINVEGAVVTSAATATATADPASAVAADTTNDKKKKERSGSGAGSGTTTALIFDTETTGMVQFTRPSIDIDQPDLVQLGFILVDITTGTTTCRKNNWTVRNTGSFLVQLRSLDTKIEKGAQQVHGISTEECRKFGIEHELVLNIFENVCQQADIIVAHNMNFDQIVMETAFHRRGDNNKDKDNGRKTSTQRGSSSYASFTELFSSKRLICTMLESIDLCKIPSTFHNRRKVSSYKWPSLLEASNFVSKETKKELEGGGHDALVDAEACFQVFQYLVDHGHVTTTTTTTTESGSTSPLSTLTEAIERPPASYSTISGISGSTYDTGRQQDQRQHPASSSSSNSNSSHKNNNGFIVRGNTYRHKETIKQLGGKWDGPSKAWIFDDLDQKNSRHAFSELEAHPDLELHHFETNSNNSSHNNNNNNGYHDDDHSTHTINRA